MAAARLAERRKPKPCRSTRRSARYGFYDRIELAHSASDCGQVQGVTRWFKKVA